MKWFVLHQIQIGVLRWAACGAPTAVGGCSLAAYPLRPCIPAQQAVRSVDGACKRAWAAHMPFWPGHLHCCALCQHLADSSALFALHACFQSEPKAAIRRKPKSRATVATEPAVLSLSVSSLPALVPLVDPQSREQSTCGSARSAVDSRGTLRAAACRSPPCRAAAHLDAGGGAAAERGLCAGRPHAVPAAAAGPHPDGTGKRRGTGQAACGQRRTPRRTARRAPARRSAALHARLRCLLAHITQAPVATHTQPHQRGGWPAGCRRRRGLPLMSGGRSGRGASRQRWALHL